MNAASVLRIAVPTLLDFFDARPPDSIGHASAITGVLGEDLIAALIADCLHQRGKTVAVRSEPVTTGHKAGNRLDRWIEVAGNGSRWLYQAEIKNWGAHSFNGRTLPSSATDEAVRAHRIDRWRLQWDDATQRFRAKECQKVVVRMKPPSDLTGLPVRALLAFWDALHPRGDPEPLFDVAVTSAAFASVTVFSASTYLRTLTADYVDLPMPAVAARIAWLSRLVSPRGA